MQTSQDKQLLLKLSAWSGPLYVFTLYIGWCVLAPFFPPSKMGPNLGALEVAKLYQDHNTGIRLGMLVMLIGSTLYIPWTALLAKLMTRYEGEAGVLTYIQIVCGTMNLLMTCLPAGILLVATFRPDRDPALIQLFNDFGWLWFFGVAAPIWLGFLAISWVGFHDRSPEPVIPRWVAWFNIWFTTACLAQNTVFFFHRGPFSWAGIFSFYFPMGGYFFWFVVMTWTVLRAIPQLVDSSAQDSGMAPSPRRHAGASIPQT